MDLEATEDPLKNPNSLKIIEDEEDESGGGVDYRRLFKGKDKKKFQSIPKRGEKDFEPDGTRKQHNLLQEGRDAMYSALSFDAGLKHGAACGVWIEEFEMTHVPQALCTGSWFQHCGIGGPTGYWLLPEETLLMVSSGRMDLLDEDGFDMGLIGAWGACIEHAGGVNTYLIYSQLRRAGYTVFRPGYLNNAPPAISSMEGSEKLIRLGMRKLASWRCLPFEMYVSLTNIVLYIYNLLLLLFHHLPAWLVPRPHRPYDAIYASLPPIATFSEISTTESIEDPLTVAFEVWRPNPQWKRKYPGPPDFHVCVLDGRDQFPTLAQLENLYNSVAQKYPLGMKAGKVVLAVVENGVSNYMTLDDSLLDVAAIVS